MKIRIKRQDAPESASYWQSFDFLGKGRKTVAGILDEINYRDDLIDENGVPSRRIRWECSCMQKMCGGCAMIINGTPALACRDICPMKLPTLSSIGYMNQTRFTV